MDLHREFSSERLGKSRSEALAFLKKHWDMSFDEISDTPSLALEAVPLFEIVYFYERLWVLVNFKQVSVSAIPDLFGEIFLWWYTVSFRQQLLRCDWKSSQDIESLYLWLKSKAPRDDWNKWVEKQEASFDKFRAMNPINPRSAVAHDA